MFRQITLVTGIFVLAAGAASWADDETDKAKLQGRWVLTSINMKGQVLPLPDGKKVVLTFYTDGKLISEGGEKGKLEGTYKIDSSKNPKQIDLLKQKEDTAGVYAFEGETLKIGMPLPVKKDVDDKVVPMRPATIEGDNVLTFTLKREGK
jgi:uncharacterized protein (TIGR03067 family)